MCYQLARASKQRNCGSKQRNFLLEAPRRQVLVEEIQHRGRRLRVAERLRAAEPAGEPPEAGRRGEEHRELASVAVLQLRDDLIAELLQRADLC